MAMTRTKMRTECYTRLAEATGFFTDANINQWLQDGVEDLAFRVEPLVNPAIADVANLVREYTLPNDLISVKFVLQFQTTAWQMLTETTYDALFHKNPAWENDTGTTASEWYWRNDVIGLYPKPTAAISGGLRIIYTYKPGAMSTDAATSGLPEWLDKAIVAYAIYRAFKKDRLDDKAMATWNEYMDLCNMAIQKMQKHRKEHGARFVPITKSYRQYYRRPHERPLIIVNS